MSAEDTAGPRDGDLESAMYAPARKPAPLRLRMPAAVLPGCLAQVRNRLTEWARELGLTEHLVDDIVLAAHEALANVADHAYSDGRRGDAVLDAVATPGEIRIEVRDHGRWRTPPADPGLRGRGLTIIHGLADRVDVDHGDAGTHIAMRWWVPVTLVGSASHPVF